MPAPFWRPIDAPQLDTRGLAFAGAGIGQAFDRFGALLAARQAKTESDALDAAKAKLLTIQDPNALKTALQADPSTYDKNVNVAQLLQFGADRQAQLTDMAGKQEDLLNKQALSQYGEAYGGLLDSAIKGDQTAMAQVKAAHANDPMFGRFLAQTAPDLANALDKGLGRLETQKVDNANIANQKGELGLRQAAFALDKRTADASWQDRLDQRAGETLGNTSADSLRLLDQSSALAKFHEGDAYKQLKTEAARTAADQAFGQAYTRLTGTTGSIDQAMVPLDSQIAAVDRSLEAATNRAKNEQITPLAKATRQAAADQPDLTLAKASEQIDPLIPGWNTVSGTDTYLARIQQDVGKQLQKELGTKDPVPVRLEDIVTAAQAGLNKPGFWNSVLPGDNGAYDRLASITKDIVANRQKGYGQNLESDLATATAPYTTRKAEIDQLKAEQVRWERAARAGAPGINTAEAQAYHAKVTKRLEELLAQPVR